MIANPQPSSLPADIFSLAKEAAAAREYIDIISGQMMSFLLAHVSCVMPSTVLYLYGWSKLLGKSKNLSWLGNDRCSFIPKEEVCLGVGRS